MGHTKLVLVGLLTATCSLSGCSAPQSEYQKQLLNSEPNIQHRESGDTTKARKGFCIKKNERLEEKLGSMISYALLAGTLLSDSRNGTVGPQFKSLTSPQPNTDCFEGEQ